MAKSAEMKRINPRDDDSNNVVATGEPVSLRPSPTENRTISRSRSPGSRVVAFARLPKVLSLSGSLSDRSPVTVAGAATVLNRVPMNPFREPRADLNANALAGARSTRSRDICDIDARRNSGKRR